MIDAHFHVWQLKRGDYGWLTPALGPIYRDVSVADWRALAEPLGVTGGILVQAAPTEDETGFLLSTAETHADVLGVVGWVDLLASDAPQRIAAWAAHPKLKGLRPMLHDLADPDWVLQAALAPAFEAMVAHHLVFDALIRPVHLPRLRVLADRCPALRIVIDHGAKPAIAQGQLEPWAHDLGLLAEAPNVYCKLSGLLTEAGDLASNADALTRWVNPLLDSFGAERMLWGSDWPVLELAGDYALWWQQCQRLTSEFTPVQRRAIFGDNARRVYTL